jgi:elongation factor G
MEPSRLRNLGIAAHIDAGKTTLSERMLYIGGVERSLGEVEEGTSALDWMTAERERGITISAAATRIPWKQCALNLIDTPGHVDFTIEVERSLRVLDGAVLVVDGVMGVQAQTETVWRQMRRHGIRALAFVNKLDRPGADYLRTVQEIARRLEVRAVPVAWPLFGEGALGVIDLVRGVSYVQRADPRSVRAEQRAFPAHCADEIGVLRAELLETLAERDEQLTRELIEGREPDPERCVALLRERVLAGELLPVLCGSARLAVGVTHLLDAVVDYLPAPQVEPDAPLALEDQQRQRIGRRELCFVRVQSGLLRGGQTLFNPRTQSEEQPSAILRLHADHGEVLESAQAGDIVALEGLENARTGDTLCLRENPCLLEALESPEAVIERTLEPISEQDRKPLAQALALLEREDPSFHAHEDPHTGQWLMEGMGELHLEIAEERLRREFELAVISGAPRVAFQEVPGVAAQGLGEVDRQVGERALHAQVRLSIEPQARQAAPAIEWAADVTASESVRRACEAALLHAMRSGPRTGWPVTHVRVRIDSARCEAGAEEELAFAAASVLALEAALARAQVEVLEPWMTVEVNTPPEFSGGVLADLESRGARVRLVQDEGLRRIVRVEVPLAKMFGYATDLRSRSQGRADFTMSLCERRPVPAEEWQARGLS